MVSSLLLVFFFVPLPPPLTGCTSLQPLRGGGVRLLLLLTPSELKRRAAARPSVLARRLLLLVVLLAAVVVLRLAVVLAWPAALVGRATRTSPLRVSAPGPSASRSLPGPARETSSSAAHGERVGQHTTRHEVALGAAACPDP